jgi:hypothetical protein
MGEDSPVRSTDDVLDMLLKPSKEVREELTYSAEQVEKLVKDQPEKAKALLNGEDSTSKILEASQSQRYFDEDDNLGRKLSRMKDLDYKIEDPSRFDSLIIDGSTDSNVHRITSQISKWTVNGFWMGLKTLFVFLALVPIAWMFEINLRTEPIGAAAILISLATVTIGADCWYRGLSYRQAKIEYGQKRLTEWMIERNILSVLLVGVAYLLVGTSVMGFFEDIVIGGWFFIILAILLGIKRPVQGSLFSGVLSAFFGSTTGSGPWFSMVLPELWFAYRVDSAIGTIVAATILMTVGEAVWKYPAIFWKRSYSSGPATPLPFAGFTSFLLLSPMMLTVWLLFGGQVPSFIEPETYTVFLIAACSIPFAISVLEQLHIRLVYDHNSLL